jgi:hypothetical protein
MLRKIIFTTVLAVCLNFGLSTAFAADLTGVWTSDSGGKYYIRQLHNEIWWYGEAQSEAPGWSNVAYGTLSGNKLKLKWADVPKGSIMGNGVLHLELRPGGKLRATYKTGGFADGEWTRQVQE